MKTLNKIDEFRQEASNALFTKEQALEVTQRLFEMELSDPDNSEEEIRVIKSAMERISLNYMDMTASETDSILDACHVARLNSNDIANAIDMALMEAKI